MNTIILLAEKLIDINSGESTFSNNFLEIDGIPRIQHIIEHHKELINFSDNVIFIINEKESNKYYTEDILKLLYPTGISVKVSDNTSGAVCSALLASEYIDNDEPLVIVNGDIHLVGGISSEVTQLNELNIDGGIIVFDSISPKYSFVKLNKKNEVIETSEKHPISKLATVGVYYYGKGKYFVKASKSMIMKNDSLEDKFYICPTYNQMILESLIIKTIKVKADRYFPLKSKENINKLMEASRGHE